MTRRRWIADEFSGDTAALTGDHAGHLVRVLRARVGQEFDVVAGSAVRRGKVTSITESRVEFELGEAVPGDAARNVTLLLAVFKFDRMEWAIEKCTELGISKIIPIIARRTEAHLSSAAPKRVDRWRRVALQASEQSRRVRPPEITEPIKLGEAVSFLGDLRILLAESENQTMLRSVLAANESKDEIVLAIGPEGGWTEDELQLFGNEGWISASLGATILRTETAAIAAVSLAML